MRTAHQTQAEAVQAAQAEADKDGCERGVWFVAGSSSETTGWTVPPRFIVGLAKAGAPVQGAAKITTARRGRP